MKKFVLRAVLTLIFRLLAIPVAVFFVFSEAGPGTALWVGVILVWIVFHDLRHGIEHIKRDLFGPLRDLRTISGRYSGKSVKN